MTMRKLLASLLCVLTLVFFLPARAWADAAQDSDLTVAYRDGETALTGAQFDVFLVGTVDAYGAVTATADFAGLRTDLDIGEKDADDWRALASVLEGYVALHDPKPFASALVGDNGLAVFPGLPAGLYFVRGHRLTLEDVCYDCEPFIVRLPHYDEVSGQWLDALTVQPKHYIPDGNPVTRKVLKVWDDEGFETLRPAEITVHLLCNDEIYDTVKLTADNNWRYTWTDLNGFERWSVTEEVPTGYTVQITKEGITFVVTNSYEEPTPPPPPPPEELPQTGQLWWPVPILVCAGLFLTAAGLLRRRGERHEG